MKSNDYKSIIDYSKRNNIRFAAINKSMEIDVPFEFNEIPLIDTETFEIPICFEVERALVLCIPTPVDMTPEDTGKSYQKYIDYVNQLRQLSRPQYIGLDGCYIKVMMWCDFGRGSIIDDMGECCQEAINSVTKSIKNATFDFRIFSDVDPTPDIYSADMAEIIDMVYDHYNGNEFDGELYINIENSAYNTGHGIETTMYEGMLLIENY